VSLHALEKTASSNNADAQKVAVDYNPTEGDEPKQLFTFVACRSIQQPVVRVRIAQSEGRHCDWANMLGHVMI
jgi:hypothetical protein